MPKDRKRDEPYDLFGGYYRQKSGGDRRKSGGDRRKRGGDRRKTVHGGDRKKRDDRRGGRKYTHKRRY